MTIRLSSCAFLLLFICLPLFAEQQPIEIQILPSGPRKSGVQKIVPRQARTEDQILIDRARATEQRGDYEHALPFWQEVLRRSPWNPEAMQAVPRNLIILKRYDQAEAFLNDLMQKMELNEQAVPLSDPSSP